MKVLGKQPAGWMCGATSGTSLWLMVVWAFAGLVESGAKLACVLT